MHPTSQSAPKKSFNGETIEDQYHQNRQGHLSKEWFPLEGYQARGLCLFVCHLSISNHQLQDQPAIADS